MPPSGQHPSIESEAKQVDSKAKSVPVEPATLEPVTAEPPEVSPLGADAKEPTRVSEGAEQVTSEPVVRVSEPLTTPRVEVQPVRAEPVESSSPSPRHPRHPPPLHLQASSEGTAVSPRSVASVSPRVVTLTTQVKGEVITLGLPSAPLASRPSMRQSIASHILEDCSTAPVLNQSDETDFKATLSKFKTLTGNDSEGQNLHRPPPPKKIGSLKYASRFRASLTCRKPVSQPFPLNASPSAEEDDEDDEQDEVQEMEQQLKAMKKRIANAKSQQHQTHSNSGMR